MPDLVATARPPSQTAIVSLVAVCLLTGGLGWVFWVAVLHKEIGQDWMVFYTSARTWFDGDLARLYDGVWLTDTINHRYAAWLDRTLVMHPWLYPPHLLLLLLPFGALSFVMSYVLFMALTFAGMTVALSRITGHAALVAVALLLFPQAPFALLAGQNSYLTGALLIGGFALLDANPVVAGILLGIMSYKPQMFLMVPLALLAGRHWKAISAGIATGVVLTLAGLAVFGIGIWRDWLNVMLFPTPTYAEWLAHGRIGGQSVYACVLVLGGSRSLATIAETLGMLIAGAAVWWSFHRPMPRDLRIAVLLAATLLAAPHVSSQDGLLLAAAGILLFRRVIVDGGSRTDLAVIGAIWVAELVDPPVIFYIGVVTPLVIVWFIAVTMRRASRFAA